MSRTRWGDSCGPDRDITMTAPAGAATTGGAGSKGGPAARFRALKADRRAAAVTDALTSPVVVDALGKLLCLAVILALVAGLAAGLVVAGLGGTA